MLQLLTKIVTTIDKNNTAISESYKKQEDYNRAVLKMEYFKVCILRDLRRLLGAYSQK